MSVALVRHPRARIAAAGSVTVCGVHGRRFRLTGPRGLSVEVRPHGARWVLSLRPLGLHRGHIMRQESLVAALVVAERFARRFC